MFEFKWQLNQTRNITCVDNNYLIQCVVCKNTSVLKNKLFGIPW